MAAAMYFEQNETLVYKSYFSSKLELTRTTLILDPHIFCNVSRNQPTLSRNLVKILRAKNA